MFNKRLDLRIGLHTLAAFLYGSILTKEETKGEIRTPLLNRLDYREAAASRCSV